MPLPNSFLTSACLAAALALSVVSARGDTLSAPANDAGAAQESLRPGATRLAAGDDTRAAPAADPVMTEELIQRLIKFARGQKGNGSVTHKICAIFDLCDGTEDMPLKLLETERPEGTFFGLPIEEGSKDILIMRKHDGIVDAYLTDKTGKLRAAAVADGKPAAHLITNEKAAANYEAALRALAREAAEDLPPTH